MTARTRLAIDIGGTFTDLVLSKDGETVSTKLLTTPTAPEQAVITGTREILMQAGVAAESLDLVIHGTTLATNALIERKGARTALVTTRGFRDSIEIAYEHRFEQYDLYMERPAPLVDRDLRLEVTERMASDGSVLLPLDTADLDSVAQIIRDRDIEAIAISFLHSYVNPDHEERARDRLAAALPGVSITISSEVCREIREYERTSTTIANAYVLPLMDRYIAAMQDGLSAIGLRCPLLLMMSSGAICTVQTARRFPVRLVESGPAGGVILARTIAEHGSYARALSFDMGGTTAKITLIDDFQPQQSRHFEVARAYRFAKGSGIPVRIPVIDMVEIGAGGGSIARVDDLRRIVVGPDSAGSEPGPAGYGRGGSAPTVTDADIVLGRVDVQRFAGGKIALVPDRSAEAVRAGVAAGLGMTVPQAARGISEIVDENMASAARVHAVENGKETADRTLIAFGGAAPLHAVRLAQKLGISRIVIPPDAGVGSAHGFLGAPIAYEVVRTMLARLDRLDHGAIDRLFGDMRVEAEAVVRQGYPDGPVRETRTAYMRYRGQGHEIPVLLPSSDLDPASLRAAFDATYQRLFGRVIPRLEVEAVTWTLSLAQPSTTPVPREPPVVRDAGAATDHRPIVDAATGQTTTHAVYPRDLLLPGMRISGPAAVVESGTTTIVPAGFIAIIDAGKAIVIEGSTP